MAVPQTMPMDIAISDPDAVMPGAKTIRPNTRELRPSIDDLTFQPVRPGVVPRDSRGNSEVTAMVFDPSAERLAV